MALLALAVPGDIGRILVTCAAEFGVGELTYHVRWWGAKIGRGDTK